ncbi:MAG: hypothetical protein ACFB3T_08645 [Geminicoccaceae bacterium]
MADNDTSEPTRPRLKPGTAASHEERAARLAEAMRANLKRRKAQARGRAGAAQTSGAALDEDGRG